MKQNRQRILAAALLTSALLSAASCGGETQAQPTETTGAQNTQTVTEAVTEPEKTHYIDYLEPVDYGGAEFRFYTVDTLTGRINPVFQNNAEEETGEVVNDALFARNRWLEETFNVDYICTIAEKDETGFFNKQLTQAVLAGERLCDLAMNDTAEVAKTQTVTGQAYPVNLVPGIDLEADYWFPKLNEELKIGENLFIAASAISPRFYGSAYIIVFNKDLASELDLPNMYTLVEDGTWTFDSMMENARVAYSDLNGDGVMGKEDRYGFFWEILTPETFMLGAGMHYAKNVDGTFQMMMDDEKLVSFLGKIHDCIYEPCALPDLDADVVDSVFNDGRYLYWNPCTCSLASYRDLPYDYGVLPMPKYDAQQKEYIAYAQPWIVASPVIPATITGEDLERAGTIINAMAAYGYDYIRPAVFENVIQIKGSRDEESARIIDRMFENITFELTSIFPLGGFAGQFHNFFLNNQQNNVVSTYEKIRSKVDSDIETLLLTYNRHAENLSGNGK